MGRVGGNDAGGKTRRPDRKADRAGGVRKIYRGNRYAAFCAATQSM
jgi:hypothetical protein